MVGPIAKPVMRGMCISYIKKGIIGAVSASIVAGVAFKFLFMDSRRKIYDDFYATYDKHAAVQRLNRSGFMSSSPENIAKRRAER
ncbi:uncharacterized protein LOC122498599 [Leptopilina heterotoma]|uniref:uncharacterized protein LOC122498599 n=1 Tax=Leptopilina heterotoma TaxID=63436 RepID=UPI001CA98505|nr:uncharacterized protein LOC122498599 [Leptopilina heterotoma]